MPLSCTASIDERMSFGLGIYAAHAVPAAICPLVCQAAGNRASNSVADARASRAQVAICSQRSFQGSNL